MFHSSSPVVDNLYTVHVLGHSTGVSLTTPRMLCSVDRHSFTQGAHDRWHGVCVYYMSVCVCVSVCVSVCMCCVLWSNEWRMNEWVLGLWVSSLDDHLSLKLRIFRPFWKEWKPKRNNGIDSFKKWLEWNCNINCVRAFKCHANSKCACGKGTALATFRDGLWCIAIQFAEESPIGWFFGWDFGRRVLVIFLSIFFIHSISVNRKRPSQFGCC